MPLALSFILYLALNLARSYRFDLSLAIYLSLSCTHSTNAHISHVYVTRTQRKPQAHTHAYTRTLLAYLANCQRGTEIEIELDKAG